MFIANHWMNNRNVQSVSTFLRRYATFLTTLRVVCCVIQVPRPRCQELEFTAIRSEAQRLPQRAQAHEDWAFYKKVDSPFHCHILCPLRVQWRHLRESLDARLPSTRACHMAQSLFHILVTLQPAPSSHIAVLISLSLAVECHVC